MSELDISLDIMEIEESNDEYRWRLQTKVDEDSHDAVIEFANKFTRGNISGAVRYMVQHHIQEHGGVYTSPIQKAWLELKAHQRKVNSRLERIRALHQAAIELHKHPDAEYELAAGTLAEKLGVTWPIPEKELPKESLVNDDLRYLMDHLEMLWQDNGGTATLRDLQRKTNSKYNTEQTREHLETLSSEDRVQLVFGKRSSIIISPS